MSELKPCPFCGASNHLEVGLAIYCNKCHSYSSIWNDRVSQPEQTEAQRDLDKELANNLEILRQGLGACGAMAWPNFFCSALLRTVIRLAEKE